MLTPNGINFNFNPFYVIVINWIKKGKNIFAFTLALISKSTMEDIQLICRQHNVIEIVLSHA